MSKRSCYPAEAFFRKPYDIDDRITRLKNEVRRLDYLMLPSGIDYSKPAVTSTPDDVMSRYQVEKKDIETEIARLQKQYLEEKRKVKIVLRNLDRENGQGATILSEYYISHKPINRIAKEHNYTRDAIYKARNKALHQAQKYINLVK